MVNELTRRKAEKEGDAKLWSPLDALEDTVERIKSGDLNPQQIVMHVLEKPNDRGERQHRYVVAGVDYPDHIALLNIALRRILNDWVEERA